MLDNDKYIDVGNGWLKKLPLVGVRDTKGQPGFKFFEWYYKDVNTETALSKIQYWVGDSITTMKMEFKDPNVASESKEAQAKLMSHKYGDVHPLDGK